MILVTGTMRSGTSMWMQILIAAGLPHIGEAFPAPWGESLRPANPRGFYESQLVSGVYYATNPHPETGAFLAPESTRAHLCKVFIPGLVRTDLAFMDRVIGTVRGWRAFCASLDAMGRLVGDERERALFEVPLDPPVRWWMENFALVRDVATRGYPAHVGTYERLVDAPEGEIGAVLDWIEAESEVSGLDREAAVAAVRAELRSDRDAPSPDGISPRHAQVFDELHGHLHRGEPLSPAFVGLLNRTDAELRPRLVAARAAARAVAIQHLSPPE